MDLLHTAWAASLVSAAWLLIVGTIRILAYRSGETDHTSGMRMVARVALGLGVLATVVFVVLTIVIVSR